MKNKTITRTFSDPNPQTPILPYFKFYPKFLDHKPYDKIIKNMSNEHVLYLKQEKDIMKKQWKLIVLKKKICIFM